MKPIGSTLSITINAALSVLEDRVEWGWIVRDSEGQLIFAACKSQSGTFSPHEAEALGVREVLSWLRGKQLDDVIIESDSQVTINHLRQSSCISPLGSIIDDCKNLASHFANVCFKFVKRSANKAAHAMAQAALSMSDCMEWHLCPPDFFMDVLRYDIS